MTTSIRPVSYVGRRPRTRTFVPRGSLGAETVERRPVQHWASLVAQTRSGSLRDAALRYAAAGLPILPLCWSEDFQCSCGNSNCSSAGKHPRTRRGFKDASCEPEIVDGWWKRWPKANIGLATGQASGVMVLDIDPRNEGDRSLAELIDQLGPLPLTIEQQTGGGGRHLFFQYEETKKPRTLCKGVDFKTDGGYVVVSPSVHVSGTAYRWADIDTNPETVRPRALPPLFLSALHSQARTKPSPVGEARVASEPLQAHPRQDAALPWPRLRIDVQEVARELGLKKTDGSYHCWHPENHARGDEHASVKFWEKGNALHCFVCDRGVKAPFELVMDVLALSPDDALLWIKSHFPESAKLESAAFDMLVESGLFAKLSPSARVLAAIVSVLVNRPGDENGLSSFTLSYAAFRRYSGIRSPNALKQALDELIQLGWLRRVPRIRSGILRPTGSYRLTPLSPQFLSAVANCHPTFRASIEEERELANAKRDARMAELPKRTGPKGSVR